jgi:hypothetical protein
MPCVCLNHLSCIRNGSLQQNCVSPERFIPLIPTTPALQTTIILKCSSVTCLKCDKTCRVSSSHRVLSTSWPWDGTDNALHMHLLSITQHPVCQCQRQQRKSVSITSTLKGTWWWWWWWWKILDTIRIMLIIITNKNRISWMDFKFRWIILNVIECRLHVKLCTRKTLPYKMSRTCCFSYPHNSNSLWVFFFFWHNVCLGLSNLHQTIFRVKSYSSRPQSLYTWFPTQKQRKVFVLPTYPQCSNPSLFLASISHCCSGQSVPISCTSSFHLWRQFRI